MRSMVSLFFISYGLSTTKFQFSSVLCIYIIFISTIDYIIVIRFLLTQTRRFYWVAIDEICFIFINARITIIRVFNNYERSQRYFERAYSITYEWYLQRCKFSVAFR